MKKRKKAHLVQVKKENTPLLIGLAIYMLIVYFSFHHRHIRTDGVMLYYSLVAISFALLFFVTLKNKRIPIVSHIPNTIKKIATFCLMIISIFAINLVNMQLITFQYTHLFGKKESPSLVTVVDKYSEKQYSWRRGTHFNFYIKIKYDDHHTEKLNISSERYQKVGDYAQLQITRYRSELGYYINEDDIIPLH